ncbi:MAG: hypothetical protein A3C35_06425 [Omnitrophica bacterium RIFCSPHIGHO2_02_FULL_46_11]|nr:MAG: hypothetical protein A3A81_05155 [Omnitrophica bacterium RIFCSPLOWO2_01_FULL_45_10b]OGW87703.1 MAG: hypothetical protein A3C35_06425 [Omnitrophica bacterium RIFCSPHIGHO2_02_FULL_46_11]
MSIITEALRKAEREHELKAKRALQEAASGLADPGKSQNVLLAQSEAVEHHIQQSVLQEEVSQAVFRRPAWYWSSRLQAVFLAALGVLVCAFILTILPKWPQIGNNFSIVWQPSVEKGSSQISISEQGVFSGTVGAFSQGNGSRTQKSELQGKNMPTSQFVLSGISVMGNDHYAIVNGTIVQKGDSIDGAYVKDVFNQEVILQIKDGEIKLKIPSSF